MTVAAVRGWCLGGGLALINGHDLCIAGESAKFGMPEVIRGSYGAVATSTLFHSGIPFKKAFYIQLTGRNLTAAEAERVGLISEVVPDDQLMPNVEQLAKELGSRNAVTLESAKIAAYMQKDMDFLTALKTDDLVSHRMRYYTNPLSNVEGYLHSQKGGGTTGYVKPEDRKKYRFISRGAAQENTTFQRFKFQKSILFGESYGFDNPLLRPLGRGGDLCLCTRRYVICSEFKFPSFKRGWAGTKRA